LKNTIGCVGFTISGGVGLREG